MEISDLTPAEARVSRAFPRGQAVDFRTADDEDATDGGGWGAGAHRTGGGAAGWILATTVAAGVTRAVSRQ
jgi:hypothetical protein